MTFRKKLILALSFILAFALGGAFLSVYYIVARSENHQFDDDLVAAARNFSTEISLFFGDDFEKKVQDAINAEYNDKPNRLTILFRADGSLLFTPPRSEICVESLTEQAHKTLWTPFDFECKGLSFRAVALAVPNRRQLFLVMVATRHEVEQDRRFMAKSMLFALFASMLLSAILVYALSASLTRDHAEMARVVRAVSGGDFSRRLKLQTGDPDLIQLAKDVNEMIAALSHLLRSREQFIAHAAHELRSPLTSIYGELSLALRKERSAESYKETIIDALESTRTLKSLAEKLLTLARIQHAAHYEKKNSSIVEIVALAKEPLRQIIDQKKIRFVQNIEHGEIVCVALDVVRMVRNLLENAIKHSPTGGEIGVTAMKANMFWHLIVEDRGEGIKEGDLEHLFLPFYRGSKERADDESGTGLGLVIVNEIVKAHGGRISVRNAEPTGAIFEIDLPLI